MHRLSFRRVVFLCEFRNCRTEVVRKSISLYMPSNAFQFIPTPSFHLLATKVLPLVVHSGKVFQHALCMPRPSQQDSALSGLECIAISGFATTVAKPETILTGRLLDETITQNSSYYSILEIQILSMFRSSLQVCWEEEAVCISDGLARRYLDCRSLVACQKSLSSL